MLKMRFDALTRIVRKRWFTTRTRGEAGLRMDMTRIERKWALLLLGANALFWVWFWIYLFMHPTTPTPQPVWDEEEECAQMGRRKTENEKNCWKKAGTGALLISKIRVTKARNRESLGRRWR